jgi:hypothetical protein
VKFLGFACLAVLLGIGSATEQMQIDYYSNNKCSEFEGDVVVTWGSASSGEFNCFGYNYGTSLNIANCYEDYITPRAVKMAHVA